MIRTAALILAAGFGTRLKSIGPKPLLTCYGKTFLELVVKNPLAVKLDPIIILTNKEFCLQIQNLKLPFKTVINNDPEKGMLSSILIGLEEIEKQSDGFFLCPVDYPLVKLETYQILLSTFCENKNHIIKPQFNKQSGHPIVIPQNLFGELKSAPLDQGTRHVTNKYSRQTCFVNVTDPGILLNINSPEMYHKYCE
jgi:molybdenum cofactor cytidylyltransferase